VTSLALSAVLIVITVAQIALGITQGIFACFVCYNNSDLSSNGGCCCPQYFPDPHIQHQQQFAGQGYGYEGSNQPVYYPAPYGYPAGQFQQQQSGKSLRQGDGPVKEQGKPSHYPPNQQFYSPNQQHQFTGGHFVRQPEPFQGREGGSGPFKQYPPNQGFNPYQQPQPTFYNPQQNQQGLPYKDDFAGGYGHISGGHQEATNHQPYQMNGGGNTREATKAEKHKVDEARQPLIQDDDA